MNFSTSLDRQKATFFMGLLVLALLPACNLWPDINGNFIDKGDRSISEDKIKEAAEDIDGDFIVPMHAVDTASIQIASMTDVSGCRLSGRFGKVYKGKSRKRRKISPERLRKEALEDAASEGASHLVWLPNGPGPFIAQAYRCPQ